MNSAAEKSLVGQLLLGRYRVMRRLALGGMGAVYLARTEGARGFSKPVVIKRILPIWGGDEEIASLFAREARILSQLQDPGIVSVIDFGQIGDGTLVMVLDYVHGYHLAHWLSYLRLTQGNMPVEMAVHIMIRVLTALHYAHTFVKPDGKPLAVIHRDVSPANILLDTSGNVKLVDFGIARAEGDTDEYKTEAPQLRGKFGYLAPELFTGAPPTPRSDIYAAAVVLYELLTGDNPFRGRELADSYHKALTVVPPPVSSLRDDVTDGLISVINTALARDPNERYASAAEFAEALRRERAAPDEACQARLRAAVQKAFAGPLADALGIEPLSAVDEVWRDLTPDGTTPGFPSQAPSAAESQAIEGPAPAGASSPPQAARVSVAADGRMSVAPPATGPSHTSDQPTLRRVERRSSSPPALRPTHLRLIAVLSMVLFGAFLVAGILRSFEHKEDQVIVIEREPNLPKTSALAGGAASTDSHAAEPAAANALLDQGEQPAPTEARLSGAVRAASTKSNSGPAEPDPGLLTSRFAREQPRVQRCFATRARSGDTEGELTVEFQVSSAGVVERAELWPRAVAKTPLGSCLLEVAKNTSFPRLTRAVTFRIPIQARVAQP